MADYRPVILDKACFASWSHDSYSLLSGAGKSVSGWFLVVLGAGDCRLRFCRVEFVDLSPLKLLALVYVSGSLSRTILGWLRRQATTGEHGGGCSGRGSDLTPMSHASFLIVLAPSFTLHCESSLCLTGVNFKFSFVALSPLCVLLLLEIITGGEAPVMHDGVPVTGAMRGLLSRVGVSCDGSRLDLLSPAGWSEATLPDGCKDREARMESPMLGGRDPVKKDKVDVRMRFTWFAVISNCNVHNTMKNVRGSTQPMRTACRHTEC